MLGLFSTLNLGARSLQVQQTGVEVTGQNLANVNNPAYARQRANISTSFAINSPVGPFGTGSQVVSIQQLRNLLLDGQIRDELSVGGYWNAQQSALQNAQSQLGSYLNPNASTVNSSASTNDTAATLSDQLDNLFNAFQSIATNPLSLTQRQALISKAQSLTTSLNQASRGLTGLHDVLDASLNNDVAATNALLSDVARLNEQISRSEIKTNGVANDLRDLREQKLEELSKLVNYQTGTNTDGGLTLSIDGNMVVDGQNVVDTLETYDAGGGQFLVRTATSATPLNLSGGSMQGTIDVRDGAVASLRSDLDLLASTLITQVNAIYSAGYDLNGGTGGMFFTGTDAATIGVNAALLTDPSLIQASGVAGTVGDNSVALTLAQLGRQPQAALGNQTFASAYAGTVASLGSALQGVNNEVASYNAVNTMLSQQRESVSGVSIDEEMANLLAFQKAYTASARIVTTVDEMLNTILEMKR